MYNLLPFPTAVPSVKHTLCSQYITSPMKIREDLSGNTRNSVRNDLVKKLPIVTHKKYPSRNDACSFLSVHLVLSNHKYILSSI